MRDSQPQTKAKTQRRKRTKEKATETGRDRDGPRDRQPRAERGATEGHRPSPLDLFYWLNTTRADQMTRARENAIPEPLIKYGHKLLRLQAINSLFPTATHWRWRPCPRISVAFSQRTAVLNCTAEYLYSLSRW